MKNLNFLKQNLIAHRGDFDNIRIPENSYTAFRNAMEKNYIIELDIHLTKDNKIVVFHDDDISRMTGKEGKIKDFTLEELKDYKLLGIEEIPILEDVLWLIDGKVPILIELKYDREVGELEEKLVEILDNYKGKFAIQSFHPLIVRWFKKNRKDYIRGLLISDEYKNIFEKIMFKTFFIFISKPDFISCNYNFFTDKEIKKNKKKRMILAWTINNQAKYFDNKNKFDNLICEKIDNIIKE